MAGWTETTEIRCYCKTCKFNQGVFDHGWGKCKRKLVVISDKSPSKCLNRRDR